MGRRKKELKKKKDCLLNCQSIEIYTKNWRKEMKTDISQCYNRSQAVQRGDGGVGVNIKKKINQPPVPMFIFEFHI